MCQDNPESLGNTKGRTHEPVCESLMSHNTTGMDFKDSKKVKKFISESLPLKFVNGVTRQMEAERERQRQSQFDMFD